ncbi:MAG TPA: ABC transporter ATP-binding protein, partial [Cyclobacteriaceae bacterium]|nr:ABC transporter ATP-binding protein [Cyclobacteriaceae bacterium]
LQNFKKTDSTLRKKLSSDLKVLQAEIKEELNFVGKTDFNSLEKLTAEKFDSTTYYETQNFLNALKRFYISRYNKADIAKDKKINAMTRTSELEKEFEATRNSYQNESIAELVKNTVESNRIIEKNGTLIQKIFPIYKNPDPSHMVDFKAQFYMPAKHFLNQNIDTFYFNLGVIWAMTTLLIITLYFEVLRKIVDGLGNISNPIPKRM